MMMCFYWYVFVQMLFIYFYLILGFGLIYIATKCYVETLITFFHMVLAFCLCLVFDYCRLCILLKVLFETLICVQTLGLTVDQIVSVVS